MIPAHLRDEAGTLADGTSEYSRRWHHLAWAQLGFDVAESGIAHYTIAIRELWPHDRPIPEALDEFRAGFAAYRRSRRRPALYSGLADSTD